MDRDVKVPTFTDPLSVSVPLRGGAIVVQTANMKQLLLVKARLLPVLELVAREAPQFFDEEQLRLMVETRSVTAKDIASLCVLLEHAGVALEFVAALTPLSLDQVEQLMPDEFAYTFAMAVQVNADFFAQALPVLADAVRRLQRVGVLAGGTSSSPAPSTS
jgi:hypothetical protein